MTSVARHELLASSISSGRSRRETYRRQGLLCDSFYRDRDRKVCLYLRVGSTHDTWFCPVGGDRGTSRNFIWHLVGGKEDASVHFLFKALEGVGSFSSSAGAGNWPISSSAPLLSEPSWLNQLATAQVQLGLRQGFHGFQAYVIFEAVSSPSLFFMERSVDSRMSLRLR